MTKTIHGKVHGKTIELDEDPGVAEGPGSRGPGEVGPSPPGNAGEGILRTAGGSGGRPRMGFDHGGDPSRPKAGTPSPVTRPGGGMTLLLDTDICSAHMRRPRSLRIDFSSTLGD